MLQLWSPQHQHIASNRSRVGKRAAAKSGWLTPCERTHDSVKILWPKSALMTHGFKGLGRECAAFKWSFCLLTSYLSQYNSESVCSEKQELCLRFWLWLVLSELLSGSEREKGPERSVLHNQHCQKEPAENLSKQNPLEIYLCQLHKDTRLLQEPCSKSMTLLKLAFLPVTSVSYCLPLYTYHLSGLVWLWQFVCM